jgi:hypothetical protein
MTLWEIALIALAFALILIFTIAGKRLGNFRLRKIAAFSALRNKIELSVEDGTKVHVSLGAGNLLGPQSAAAFAGLNLLRELSNQASDSDQPPFASSGDGSLTLLAQDSLRRNYETMNIGEEFDNRQAQVAGLTAIPYSAAMLPIILDDEASTHIFAGRFGPGAGLISSAKDGAENFIFAGSDALSGQALFYAGANEALIGEELYAAGAYLGAGAAHVASLRTQDSLRTLSGLTILGLALGQLIGVFN